MTLSHLINIKVITEQNLRMTIEVRIIIPYYFIEMDTTVISDIEYINILPDLDMDDSSFLKGSFVNGSAAVRNDNSKNDNS